MLLDLYFRVIMLLIVYGILVWGGFINKEGFKVLEVLYCRVVRIIFELFWEMFNVDVMKKVNWFFLVFMYKISLVKFMYKIYNNLILDVMLVIIKNNNIK